MGWQQRWWRFGAVAIALAVGATDAKAFLAIGNGTGSCGAWTADRRRPMGLVAQAEEQWILGFLSGVGYESQDTIDPLNNVDAEAVWAWMDNYCLAHPLERIMQAAEAFVIEHPR